MSNKNCISCGMPIRKPAEAAIGDDQKPYCYHCAQPDGSMKSYSEVLVGMTAFIVQTQGLDESVAQGLAGEMLEKQPAWRTAD